MTPKPNVEWVKNELEIRGIRVTSRKAGRHAREVSSHRDTFVSSDPGLECLGMSFTQQIPFTNPHSIVDTAINFHTDQGTNFVKGKEPLYESSAQARSPASVVDIFPYSIAKNVSSEVVRTSEQLPSEIFQRTVPLPSKIVQRTMRVPSDYQIHPVDSQQRISDSYFDVSRTTRISTENQVEDEVARQFVRLNQEELEIDEKWNKEYADLKMRYSEIEKERKNVKLLMDYYRNKRLWQLLQEHYNKRKSKIQNDYQFRINQASYDPQAHQYSTDIQRHIDKPKEMENAIMSIIPDEWKY